ncbi:hypothetical protein ACA910_011208 [Epithemia clementina (nom. ined.)]
MLLFLLLALTTILSPQNPLFGVGTVVVVDAKCQAFNHHGKEVVLTTSILPKGVEYDYKDDQMECKLPSACRDWTITNCTRLECNNEFSCRGAKLIQNQNVLCAWFGSCQDATIQQAEHVTCGGPSNSDKYCLRANIEASLLTCHGPRSCVAKDPQDAVVAKVWNSGQIHCENALTKEWACAQMSLHIRFGHQACIDEQKDLHRGCPIVCVNAWDCDRESLFFLPEPEANN